jgi:hypothetical protein
MDGGRRQREARRTRRTRRRWTGKGMRRRGEARERKTRKKALRMTQRAGEGVEAAG